MSTAQRVSRGFHRLGLFLAVIPLLIGSYISIVMAPDWTAPFSSTWRLAPTDGPWKDYAPQHPSPPTDGSTGGPWHNDPIISASPTGHFVPDPTVNIEGTGSVQIENSPGFEKWSPDRQQKMVDQIVATNWRTKFGMPLAEGLAITLGISLAVYGVVRAVGWVIGGFAAS